MRRQWEESWRFQTANLLVVFEVAPCEDDPADSFEDEESIQDIRDGNVCWFDARVRVLLSNGQELGADYLSCCAYNTLEEFYQSHRDPDAMNRNCTIMRRARGGKNDPDAKISICHYFPSMVSEAVAGARQVLERIRSVSLRVA